MSNLSALVFQIAPTWMVFLNCVFNELDRWPMHRIDYPYVVPSGG